MFRIGFLLACTLASGFGQAVLEINKTTLTVRTRTLQIKFDQGAVTSLRNQLTNEEYIHQAGPPWFDLTATQPLPGSAIPGEWSSGQELDGTPNATLPFIGAGRNLSLTVTFAPDDEVVLRFAGRVDNPGLISATWGIFGLNLSPGRMVIPGQAGAYFDTRSTPDFVGLDYPVYWENQMVIYEGGVGSFLFYSPDAKPNYQQLQATRQTGNLDMAVEMFAAGPFPNATDVPIREWHFAGFTGNWREPAARYKERMTGIRPFVAPTGARAWIRDIRAVVMFLTSDTTLLDIIAKQLIPSQTLIHYVDWRNQPFDFYYPDYTPSDNAKQFVAYAHQLGFRVMLHANVLGISEVHPSYPDFARFQLKRADDLAPIGWLWDQFPPGSPRRVAYISPASSAFRTLFADSIRPAIEQLKPDAIHLDAGGALINDGNGLIEGMNSMEGMIQLHQELIDKFPDIVWGGESTNEIIGPYNWLAQRWPSYSLPHPVSNFLLGDQVFYYGFLDQPPPDEPDFVDYLKQYEIQGVAPAVIVVSPDDLAPDKTRTYDLLARLRLWQEKQYSPDWTSNLDTGLFRYKSADGASSATVEGDSEFVHLEEQGNVLYQRIRNSNRAVTPLFIDSWPAYDDESLLGLDPAREYWLGSVPFRPSGQIHLQQMPENFKLGTGSLVNQRYGYFEIQPVQQQWFDFIASFATAQLGTLYGGKNYPLADGAYVTVSRAIVGGDLRNSALFALPPSKGNLNGATFIDYKIAVPNVPSVGLTFEAGIADSAGQSAGVLFGIQINGATQWRQTVSPGKWQQGSVDLTPYAGTTIVLRLLTTVGPSQNPAFDLACWASLNLQTSFDQPNAPLTLGGPAGSQLPGYSAGVSSDNATPEGLTPIRVSLPGSFVVFVEEPPAIGLGESLLDFPYDVWKQGYDGLPVSGSVQGSGLIEAATSAGVERSTTLSAEPPKNGVTIITTAVTIADGANWLQVEYGFNDPPASYGSDFTYSGAGFSVQINGDNIFTDSVFNAGWRSQRISLEAYRGKRVLVQFKVDSQGLSLYDWGRWTNLTVI
jgi:hypothetical protein